MGSAGCTEMQHLRALCYAHWVDLHIGMQQLWPSTNLLWPLFTRLTLCNHGRAGRGAASRRQRPLELGHIVFRVALIVYWMERSEIEGHFWLLGEGWEVALCLELEQLSLTSLSVSQICDLWRDNNN